MDAATPSEPTQRQDQVYQIRRDFASTFHRRIAKLFTTSSGLQTVGVTLFNAVSSRSSERIDGTIQSPTPDIFLDHPSVLLRSPRAGRPHSSSMRCSVPLEAVFVFHINLSAAVCGDPIILRRPGRKYQFRTDSEAFWATRDFLTQISATEFSNRVSNL